MFYFLPKFFDGFTTFFAVTHPSYLLAIVIYLAVLRYLRNLLRGEVHDACERARQSLLKQCELQKAKLRGAKNSELDAR